MDTDYLLCAFCHARVPRGATRCHGCGAQVEYGVPDALYVLVLIVALFAGSTAIGALPAALVWMGVPVALFVLVGLSLLLRKRYRRRVSFRRPPLI
ncbi:hypothetical protein WJ95_30630 [Burkholderia ubonensis]|uniref:hypothetical protein n=1 Tax=Burkholderia ubonensis TaxID=101571 RepID=UPI000757C3D8|nr:hypothetical protein [Burkholderia ubonensis]KVP98691.1 hypothetical protein WJ95_30630 [Burkholderia ubonensis]